MKVFATAVKQSGQLVIIEWPSIGAFELAESWIDQSWVAIVTTKELKEFYEYPWTRGMVAQTEVQRESHDLMHKKFLELNK